MDLILGVTGGSGCGKSAFCRAISELGAFVIDADLVAREVVAHGKPALSEIAECFGSDYLLDNGELDRRKLGALVFSHPEKLHMLNDITHKYIIEEIKSKLRLADKGLRVIDAAVLFESGLGALCGRTACVLADKRVRAERIVARDGLTWEEALSRIDAQKSDEFYRRRANDVILNNGSETELREAAKKYWSKLEKVL